MDNKNKSLFREATETGDFSKYLENKNNAVQELLGITLKCYEALNLKNKFNSIKVDNLN